LKLLNKVIGWAENICLLGSCAALLAIMLLTTADVLIRKMSDFSIPGLFEFTEDYLMVAIVFLAVSHVYQSGGHVKVSLFEKTIPPVLRKPLAWMKNLAALAFFALIAVTGWESAMSALTFGELSHGAIAYPLAPALFMVPAGAGLTCLRIVQTIVMPATIQEEG
jgi:TRAP-type transport system small permease protein